MVRGNGESGLAAAWFCELVATLTPPEIGATGAVTVETAYMFVRAPNSPAQVLYRCTRLRLDRGESERYGVDLVRVTAGDADRRLGDRDGNAIGDGERLFVRVGPAITARPGGPCGGSLSGDANLTALENIRPRCEGVVWYNLSAVEATPTICAQAGLLPVAGGVRINGVLRVVDTPPEIAGLIV